MNKVFCFGKLLLRFSPQTEGAWIAQNLMPVFIGGAELNVATALAQWGVPVEGTHRYNDRQWLGFSGENMEAVIDLGSSQKISGVGINILKYHWQRMWEPVELQFLASEDGKSFQEIYRQDNFPVNGINKVRAALTPVDAQFIKVIAQNKKLIAKGAYGAGDKPWLMVDEIFIN